MVDKIFSDSKKDKSTEKKAPRFIVVGHPNMGKSTIVSALAMDDSIAISNIPGTTFKAKEYPFTVDGKTIYTLIDTPGFQRPRRVLAWLRHNSKGIDGHEKRKLLEKFVEEFKDDPKYNDDIELLKPILDGGGVIYIVDASSPYSKEFLVDMEILQYSVAPRMAIMNFITDRDYSKDWRPPLEYYFNTIKRFNPFSATTQDYIDLLSAMSHINEDWRENINDAINAIRGLHNSRIEKSSTTITDLIFKAFTHQKRLTLPKGTPDIDKIKEKLLKDFYSEIISQEQKSFETIKKIWDHKRVQIEQDSANIKNLELFSEESEKYFGLTRQEITTYSATVGAIVGGGIDAALFGHTLLLGATIGGAIGAIGGYMSFDKLENIKVNGVTISGGIEIAVGPVKNINIGFILLTRALIYTIELATLSYAKRDEKKVIEYDKDYKDLLTNEDKRTLFKIYKALIDKKDIDRAKREHINLVKDILSRKIK